MREKRNRRSTTVRSLCVLCLLCSVSVLPPAFSQDARKPAWAELDARAEELYTSGDLKEAIRVARLALDAASDPKQSAHSMDRLGFFEYTSGNLKDGEFFL